MTDGEYIRQDYFDVQHDALTGLVASAEQLIDSGYYQVTVEQSYGFSEPVLIAGEWTAAETTENALAAGTPLTEDAAAEKARELNQGVIDTAAQAFRFLQAHATMSAVANRSLEAVDALDGTDSLAYVRAERHIVYPDTSLVVAITKLHGVEQLGEVAQYDLAADDGLVRQTLTLVTVNDRPVHISTGMQPREDEALGRWAHVFGDHMSDLYPLLVGNFEGGEQLDAALHDVRLRFVGSPQEQAIGPLLTEVRERAVMAREAAALQELSGPTLSLPGADVLGEWQARLSAL